MSLTTLTYNQSLSYKGHKSKHIIQYFIHQYCQETIQCKKQISACLLLYVITILIIIHLQIQRKNFPVHSNMQKCSC